MSYFEYNLSEKLKQLIKLNYIYFFVKYIYPYIVVPMPRQAGYYAYYAPMREIAPSHIYIYIYLAKTK